MKLMFCKECNAEIKDEEKVKRNRVYCSELCKGRYKYTKNISPRKIWRNSWFLRKYQITVEKYNEIFKSQKGKCAICEKHQSEFKLSLAVDHDHKTGHVRGLLCVKCNMVLGILEGNMNNKFNEYILKHKE